MTDKLTTDDVSEKTIDRGPDGELIPVEHEIEWGTETKTVETVPITTGVINQLSHIDDAIVELEPAAVHEAIQEIYVTPDPERFTVEDIRDLELQYLEALMSPIDRQIDEEIGEEQSGNPVEMERTDKAEKLRQ